MITFTPSEKKAILITIIIILAASLTHFFYPYTYKPVSSNYSRSDSLFTRYSNIQSSNKEKILIINGNTKKFSDNKTGNSLKKKENIILNINKASVMDLQKLPGIGPVLAGRIIEYRKGIGQFKSIEQLKQVKGVGEKTIAKLECFIRLK